MEAEAPSRRILIVANQTAPGAHLRDLVRRRMAEGPCTFTLVVPATAPHGKWTWTEEEAVEAAHQQMQEALAGLRGLGAEIDGHVEEGQPLDAIAGFLQIEEFEGHQPFNEIILSTLPPKASRWLKQDLPHRIERRYGVPVTHVIGEPMPAPSGSLAT